MIRCFKSVTTVLCRSRRFCSSSMEKKIFVRRAKDDGVMRISFTYGNSILPEKVFMFCRQKEEKLSSALARIQCKVEDAVKNSCLQIQKKAKKRKEQSTPVVESPSIEVTVRRRGEILNGDLTNEQVWVVGSQLYVDECTYDVVENPPAVDQLSLPKNIMAGFPVYPKICLEFCNAADSLFTWYRGVSKSESEQFNKDCIVIDKKSKFWAKVGEGYFYMTNNDDVGHHLKVVCLPRSEDMCGLPEEAVSLNPVSSGPGKCPFEVRHEYTKHLSPDNSIRCVSYNILADLYADSDTARNDLFPYCPAEYLQIDYRKQLFLKELLGYNGDVLCLQEVDAKVFHNDLTPVLSSAGLEGIFTEKAGQAGEGVACFFRQTKFRLIHTESVILTDAIQNDSAFVDLWSKVSENDKLKERVLSRNTVFQVTVLQEVGIEDRRVIVGNTHLYFHPDAANIRLIQSTMCIRYLESLVKRYQRENPEIRTSFIVCGDFNSCPQFGVFSLFTKGSVPQTCVDWKSSAEEAVQGMELQHTLNFDSAYGTPSYTNYTEGFFGCLDYIFYDSSSFQVADIVPLPDHDFVTEHKALPSKVFPSDHLALICTFAWK